MPTESKATTEALVLSDAGWAGSLTCFILLLLLRRPRERLKAAEYAASSTPAAALAYQLWRLTPHELLRVRRNQRLVNAAGVLVLGGCLGSGTLWIGARGLPPARAWAASAFATVSCWLVLGLAICKQWRHEALEEGIAPRPRPRTHAVTGENGLNVGDGGPSERQLPVTVLTGFLGAGKSTLLRRILAEEHGLRILVIENELGEEAIDHELVARGGDDDDIVLLRNGCLCCAIRDDLRSTLLQAS